MRLAGLARERSEAGSRQEDTIAIVSTCFDKCSLLLLLPLRADSLFLLAASPTPMLVASDRRAAEVMVRGRLSAIGRGCGRVAGKGEMAMAMANWR